MRLLAFDTSGFALSAVAAVDGTVLAYRREEPGRGHAERLLPVLTALIGDASWRWPDVELVAVTRGPGSFTGLRAGIAVARGLGLALGCKVLGLGTLEVMAQAAGHGRSLQVRLDARRGEVYAQRFAPDLRALEAPVLLPADAPVPAGFAAVTAGPDAGALAALAAARLAAGLEPAPGTALSPLYIRPPDARPGAGASLLPSVG